MNAEPGRLQGVVLLTPRVFADERGHFFESYNERTMKELGPGLSLTASFVQDNQSFSRRNVLRGLHYQMRNAQGKLVRALTGEIWDVVVDLRRGSPTFGSWESAVLSAENKRMIFVPAGFAHGFLTLSEGADVLYKTTDFWAPEHERCLLWNDPALRIDWPLAGTPIVSKKDALGKRFAEAEVFE